MGAKLGIMKGKIKVSDDFDNPLKFVTDEKCIKSNSLDELNESLRNRYYLTIMKSAGFSEDSINETMYWIEYSGLRDLLRMWYNEEDKNEREDILADISNLVNDCNKIYDLRSARPNARTLEACKEGEKGNVKSYNTIDEMLDELKNDDDDDDLHIYKVHSKTIAKLEEAYTEQAKEEAKYNNDVFTEDKYKNGVDVTIDIDDNDLLTLFKMAHEKNISLNELAQEIISEYIENNRETSLVASNEELSDSIIKGLNTPHEECSTDLEDEEDIEDIINEAVTAVRKEASEERKRSLKEFLLARPERSWEEMFDKIKPTGDFCPEYDKYDFPYYDKYTSNDSLLKRLAQVLKDLKIKADQNKWTPTPYQEKEIDKAVKWAETHKRKETDLEQVKKDLAEKNSCELSKPR